MDRTETLSIRRYVAAVSALPLVQSYAYGRRVPHTRLMLLLLRRERGIDEALSHLVPGPFRDILRVG